MLHDVIGLLQALYRAHVQPQTCVEAACDLLMVHGLSQQRRKFRRLAGRRVLEQIRVVHTTAAEGKLLRRICPWATSLHRSTASSSKLQYNPLEWPEDGMVPSMCDEQVAACRTPSL